ncbi:MAG: YciI family protein [Ktedonobacterales bacterium]
MTPPTTPMKYLLLIYDDQSAYATLDEQAAGEVYAGHMRFAAAAGKRMVDGAELRPTTTATTVRMRNGERLITDGPFAETKEQLGGYYMVECADLDEAIALAALIPVVSGCVEVRPIVQRDEGGNEL